MFPSVGLQPNVITHTAAIMACKKAAYWQCAVQLLEIFEKQSGNEHDGIMYGVAIAACEKAGQMAWVQKLSHQAGMSTQANMRREIAVDLHPDDSSGIGDALARSSLEVASLICSISFR